MKPQTNQYEMNLQEHEPEDVEVMIGVETRNHDLSIVSDPSVPKPRSLFLSLRGTLFLVLVLWWLYCHPLHEMAEETHVQLRAHRRLMIDTE